MSGTTRRIPSSDPHILLLDGDATISLSTTTASMVTVGGDTIAGLTTDLAGKVDEAPIDGTSYVRKDAGWVPESAGGGDTDAVVNVSTVPGVTCSDALEAAYAAAAAAQGEVDALEIVVSGKVDEAPIDGQSYVRRNGAWEPLEGLMGVYTAFGEQVVAQRTPRIQIDATEGLTIDQEVVTSGTGNAVASSNQFVVSTGVGLGSYGVLSSDALITYRPGQGITTEFTAKWSAPAVLGFTMAGLFGVVSGVAVGYSGTTLGLLRRIPGVRGIYQLTVTAGVAGAETATITLNGIPYVVALLAGDTTPAAVAARIVLSSVWNGTPWRPTGAREISPTANTTASVTTVTFLQNVPATAAGAFTFASTGTAAGTLSTVATGAPNDDVTGFVPQSSWSGPVGMVIDPTKLNVWKLVIPYLGAGSIELWIKKGREFLLCHTIEYENLNTVPSQGIPSYKFRYVAASLGSTTDISVSGASASAFVDGIVEPRHRPSSRSFNNYSASTTESVAIAYRCRSYLGVSTCGRELLPEFIQAFSGTANRVVTARLYLNPTITGTPEWVFHDKANSALEYAMPTAGTVTVSSATNAPVASSTFGGGASISLELAALDLRMQPGDIFVVTLQTDSSAAVCGGSVSLGEG